MAEEKKVEATQEAPQPQMQPPTKDQQLTMAFQTRLNAMVQQLNDLYRDAREIMNQK